MRSSLSSLAASSCSAAAAASAEAGSRGEVLSVYRAILRTARAIPSYNHRGHVLQKARASFRANATLQGEEEVAFARNLAATQLENLQAQLVHMKGIMNQNTLSHDAPKPQKLWTPASSSTLGQQRRSFHSSSIRIADAIPSAAKPTSPAAFWSGGVDPASSTPIAPLGMPQGLETPFAAIAAPLVATHLVHVLLTANNTIVTLTTMSGDTKAWASSGTCGFKNAKKSTYMACIAAGEQLGQKARNQNIRSVDMHISGFHKNKKAVLKGLMKAGMNVVAIRDTTPIPFNGCKPRKQRRL
jgi:small subunit ribosomal protein S11